MATFNPKSGGGAITYGGSAVATTPQANASYAPADRVIAVGGSGTGFFTNLAGRYLASDWVRPGGFPVGPGDTATSDSGDAVVLYAPAGPGTHHVLQGVSWGYSAAPASGSLSIESPSGVPVFGPVPVTAAGPGNAPFPRSLRAPENQGVLVRLAFGGGSVRGNVSVEGHHLE